MSEPFWPFVLKFQATFDTLDMFIGLIHHKQMEFALLEMASRTRSRPTWCLWNTNYEASQPDSMPRNSVSGLETCVCFLVHIKMTIGDAVPYKNNNP